MNSICKFVHKSVLVGLCWEFCPFFEVWWLGTDWQKWTRDAFHGCWYFSLHVMMSYLWGGSWLSGRASAEGPRFSPQHFLLKRTKQCMMWNTSMWDPGEPHWPWCTNGLSRCKAALRVCAYVAIYSAEGFCTDVAVCLECWRTQQSRQQILVWNLKGFL